MSRDEFVRAVDALVDAHRAQAFWYLRRDWYPTTDEERLEALAQIERRADRETYVQARRLVRWLSLESKSVSADSSRIVASKPENAT